MKTSIDGNFAGLGATGSGNFDSPFEHGSTSSRPSKPRVDPFKKFENFPT